MENQIHQDQIQAQCSKRYFVELYDKNKSFLAILMIPAFIAGWQRGKKGRIYHLGKAIMHYAKLSFISALAYIKPIVLRPILKFH